MKGFDVDYQWFPSLWNDFWLEHAWKASMSILYGEKFMVSPTGLPTEYNLSVSNRELQKITGLCHIHRRVYRRRYRHIIPTESSTDYAHPEAHACLTRVRLHTYQRLYRRLVPTESPMDLRTSRSARMCDTCPSARIPTDFLTDRKVWRDFWTFFWCAIQLISDGITDGI